MTKPVAHSTSIDEEGRVRSNSPGRFRLRVDRSGEYDQSTEVVLRCARCPKWSDKTTIALRKQRWESHLRRRHGGK